MDSERIAHLNQNDNDSVGFLFKTSGYFKFKAERFIMPSIFDSGFIFFVCTRIMQLTTNSKKLIIAIVALTGLGVLLTAPSEPVEKPTESVANTSGQSTEQNFLLDPTTIKSLTNLTQTVQFVEPNVAQQYRGYIQGVGYSSYQFHAEKDQVIRFHLEAPNTIEMLLYGANVVPLNNDTEYVIPENGLYDLRILYKPSVENQQARKPSPPQAYKIGFTLVSATANVPANPTTSQPSSPTVPTQSSVQ